VIIDSREYVRLRVDRKFARRIPIPPGRRENEGELVGIRVAH
jgi:hypothetical protein